MKKQKDTASRSWCLTQSVEKMSLDELKEALKDYVYIGQEEQGEQGGEQGYRHYQIYIENPTPIRFSTLKAKLPNCHLEKRRGKRQEAYDYVTKSETRIGEPFGNGGIDLTGRQGERTDLTDMVQMGREGKTDIEIYEAHSGSFARYHKFVSLMSGAYKDEHFGKTFRQMEVTYIWGKPRIGKSRFATDTYGFDKVYENIGYQYKGWFDKYNYEDIIQLDEFKGQFSIEYMLRILDGRPGWIDCRQIPKRMCYSKVFLTSNDPITKLYPDIQQNDPDTWQALMARIHYVWHMGFWQERRTNPHYIKPDAGAGKRNSVQTVMCLRPLSDEEAAELPF